MPATAYATAGVDNVDDVALSFIDFNLLDFAAALVVTHSAVTPAGLCQQCHVPIPCELRVAARTVLAAAGGLPETPAGWR